MPTLTIEKRTASPAAAPGLDELVLEFQRQLDTLVARGCPWAAGMTDAQFRAELAPLAERLPEAAALAAARGSGPAVPAAAPEPAAPAAAAAAAAPTPPAAAASAAAEGPPRPPFVLVVGRELIAPERAARLVERRGRRLVVSMLDADAFAAFAPIPSAVPPPGGAWLLVDVDAGWATRGDTPDAALPRIAAAGRAPLTLEEGIAVVTHQPELVATNAGFSLLGSRRGDRRVTALWISGGAPKLGWCYAGAPHTWLGSGSCAARLGM